VFEKALDDEEMEEDTEAGDEESASELEDEHEVWNTISVLFLLFPVLADQWYLNNNNCYIIIYYKVKRASMGCRRTCVFDKTLLCAT